MHSTQPSGENNFVITICTENGSGSATANLTILRSLFRMGLPISGKNIFPSNIQGLPTWYTIRANQNGFVGRRDKNDIVICMNRVTINDDVKTIGPGGVILFDESIEPDSIPPDIIAYSMPVKTIVQSVEVATLFRTFVSNMVYVGTLAFLLGIDLPVIREILELHFHKSQRAVDVNYKVVEKAFSWAQDNLQKRDQYKINRLPSKDGYIMTDGNTAAALGAIYGGLQFTAWYPITPASSMPEALNEYLPKLRQEGDKGKETYVVIQAEDEIAAIGMVIGAGWAGLRSLVSTSGPGLSLMAEFLGLAYYTEVPVVVWDVQRAGPSTGLPTRTQQGDLTFTYFLGHGDTQFVLLFPGNVNECFEFGWKALDIAEQLQTPVLVLSDLDLGMNQWMTEKFTYPDTPIQHGKILWEEELEAFLQKHEGNWGRYADADGDGIPYRTVPGNKHPRAPYLMRGTSHDEQALYTEDPATWDRMMKRIKKKFETAVKYVPSPEIKKTSGADAAIVYVGTNEMPVKEACEILFSNGVSLSQMRIRAWPFSKEVHQFLKSHKINFVVENNRDGQLRQILQINYPELADTFIQVSLTDGLPLSTDWIVSRILEAEVKNGR